MGSVRRAPRNSARWEARYRDSTGRQRTKTFDSRASAKAWLVTTETDIQRGNWLDPRLAVTRVEVVAEHWLASDDRKRPGSLARDQSIIDTHIRPPIGDRAVGSVTRSDIQRLVGAWGSLYSASTVLRHYACLRGIFTHAEDCDLILRSPCRSIRLPSVSQRQAEILNASQLQQLAGTMGAYGPMVYLAALGLRWGEIAGLRVGDVDFDRGVVTVTRQRTRGEKGRMIEQDPKTRSGKRALSMPDWLTAMLARHLANHSSTVRNVDDWVFVSPDGEPLHYSNWRRRVWLPACAAAGITGLTFHDVKHTAATALVQEGVDVKTAQVRLGHSDPKTTLGIYAQMTAEADRDAAERLGERFRPHPQPESIPVL